MMKIMRLSLYMRGKEELRLWILSRCSIGCIADNLRHTSFALVEVMPDIGEDSEIIIKEDDLDWDFYRSSSKGGQNVQKVSTAVRLKHKPSGIVVTAQSQRYQGQNREYALKLLKAK